MAELKELKESCIYSVAITAEEFRRQFRSYKSKVIAGSTLKLTSRGDPVGIILPMELLGNLKTEKVQAVKSSNFRRILLKLSFGRPKVYEVTHHGNAAMLYIPARGIHAIAKELKSLPQYSSLFEE